MKWGLIGGALAALWFLRAPILGAVGGLRQTEVELATAVMVAPSARAAEAAAASGAAANGYLVARRRAALSADTPGRIIELNVEEGTVLKKGDVVARLFSSEVEASLRRAEAELAAGAVAVEAAGASVTSAERRLEEARALVGSVTSQKDEVEAALALADSEFERAKDLFGRKAVPREQLDRAESGQAQSRARLAGAEAVLARTRAAVASAESDVEVAKLQKAQAQANIAALEAGRDLVRATLDKTFVRAPFDGVVVLKDAEVGEVVSPNALGGQSRGSVATMVDFSTLEVQVELPETSLDSVVIGRPAEVYLDAFSTERFGGTVDRIWPTANRQKATIEVRVQLDTIDPRMRPEMGVRVVFPPEVPESDGVAGDSEAPTEPQLLVPASAVVTREGQRGVFVVESGVATFRPVTAGPPLGRRVAIEKGLAEGDRVVLTPGTDLDSGSHVVTK
ncbi:efflux RND transporter periplasmic adaptor subunit [Planctomycetes bacterium Poly30]|uniref:efflux RND transporter periplasmic adaptor subunit n=1 Tax=Saltatorellus ferox TaxID=2528018 RepID=UPI0011A27716